MSNWSSFDPLASLGVNFTDQSDQNTSTTSHTASSSAPPWSHENALFWFAAFGAVTFGLIGASTHLRVGPFKAAVSAGKKS